MSKQVPWNKVLYDEFVELGGLSEMEQVILKTRMQGMTRTEQCELLQISMSTLDRAISRLKVKYDNVQKHSEVLPPRRFSAKETYMDEH